MAEPRIKLVDTESWKRADKAERENLGLIKSCAERPEPVKQYEGETERILKLVESTAARDRHADRVMQDGWRLDHYRKNPVGLWMHDHHEHPINRALHTSVENGRLVSFRQFTGKDENPFGFMTYNLLLRGFLNASSVGFRPLKWDSDADATDDDRAQSAFGDPLIFLEQELLESSIVTVPANPEALIEARSVHGIDLSPYVDFAERILDGEKGAGLWVPKDLVTREQVEKVHEIAAGRKTHSLPPKTESVGTLTVELDTTEAEAIIKALEDRVTELSTKLARLNGEVKALDAAGVKRIRDAHKKLGPVVGKLGDKDEADLSSEDEKRVRSAASKLAKVVQALDGEKAEDDPVIRVIDDEERFVIVDDSPFPPRPADA